MHSLVVGHRINFIFSNVLTVPPMNVNVFVNGAKYFALRVSPLSDSIFRCLAGFGQSIYSL